MVFSIVKQSLDIRLNFPHTPKMTADTECAAAIGMLAKLYGLPVPKRQEQLTRMRETLKQQIRDLPSTERMDKLEQMLSDYEPKLPIDDEKYELLCYTYEHTEK